jgi:hypothetical protein
MDSVCNQPLWTFHVAEYGQTAPWASTNSSSVFGTYSMRDCREFLCTFSSSALRNSWWSPTLSIRTPEGVQISKFILYTITVCLKQLMNSLVCCLLCSSFLCIPAGLSLCPFVTRTTFHHKSSFLNHLISIQEEKWLTYLCVFVTS